MNHIKLFEEFGTIGEKELGQGYGNYKVGDEYVYHEGKTPVRYKITRISNTGILFGIPIGGGYSSKLNDKGGTNTSYEDDKVWRANEQAYNDTLTIAWKKDYYSIKRWGLTYIEQINDKYLNLFKQNVRKLGYKILKEYDLQGVYYIKFDRPYGQDIVNAFNIIQKQRENEIKANENRKTNENIIPKNPCPKVKCAECGQEVCDKIGSKIGHLYLKHNCKPSVGDYKAKKMLKEYFPVAIKEEFIFNNKNQVSFPDKIGGREYFDITRVTDNKVFLNKLWGKDELETIEIDFEGNVKSHYRGNMKMKMTYNADKTTLKELNRLR